MSASGKFLLDTNIINALLEGDEAVLSNLDRAPKVFVPAIVLGELFFGAAKSGRPDENAAKLEQFAAGRFIVGCDLRVAREYGRLKQDLRTKGKPIPENDIWIAPPPFPTNWLLPHETSISKASTDWSSRTGDLACSLRGPVIEKFAAIALGVIRDVLPATDECASLVQE